MPANIFPIILLGVLILLTGGFLSIHLRHRLQSTKGIESFADLDARISENRFTLIQFFAPL